MLLSFTIRLNGANLIDERAEGLYSTHTDTSEYIHGNTSVCQGSDFMLRLCQSQTLVHRHLLIHTSTSEHQKNTFREWCQINSLPVKCLMTWTTAACKRKWYGHIVTSLFNCHKNTGENGLHFSRSNWKCFKETKNKVMFSRTIIYIYQMLPFASAYASYYFNILIFIENN